jgi:3-isopropylmalate/(R)-2-methylmalate dehydratase large subunit
MMVDRIIASHLVDGTVEPGEFVTVKVDRIYVQDGNSPTLARLFAQHGINSVFDPSRIGVFFDH